MFVLTKRSNDSKGASASGVSTPSCHTQIVSSRVKAIIKESGVGGSVGVGGVGVLVGSGVCVLLGDGVLVGSSVRVCFGEIVLVTFSIGVTVLVIVGSEKLEPQDIKAIV
jgi:hypothetical protein